MKKILLLLTAIGIVFFTSCKKEEMGSIANTQWKVTDNTGTQEMTFSSTRVVYRCTSAAGVENGYFEGTYLYDSPTVMIEVLEGYSEVTKAAENENGTAGLINLGRVSGNTLTLQVHKSADVIVTANFTKQ